MVKRNSEAFKLALQQQKFEQNLKKQTELKKLQLLKESNQKNISRLKTLQVGQQISQEQDTLRTMFGHGDKVLFSGEGRNLPEVRGIMMPHAFGDETESGTAESFGLGKVKWRSGLF